METMDVDKDWYQAVKAYYNGDFHDLTTFLKSKEAAKHGFGLDDYREFRRASQSFDAKWQNAVKAFCEGDYKTKKAFISSSKFLNLGFSPGRENSQVFKYALRFYEEELDFRESAKSEEVAVAARWGVERSWVVPPEYSIVSSLNSYKEEEDDETGSTESPGSLCDSSVSHSSGAESSETDGEDASCDCSTSENSTGDSTIPDPIKSCQPPVLLPQAFFASSNKESTKGSSTSNAGALLIVGVESPIAEEPDESSSLPDSIDGPNDGTDASMSSTDSYGFSLDGSTPSWLDRPTQLGYLAGLLGPANGQIQDSDSEEEELDFVLPSSCELPVEPVSDDSSCDSSVSQDSVESLATITEDPDEVCEDSLAPPNSMEVVSIEACEDLAAPPNSMGVASMHEPTSEVFLYDEEQATMVMIHDPRRCYEGEYGVEQMLQELSIGSDDSNGFANFMFLLFAIFPLLVFNKVESAAAKSKLSIIYEDALSLLMPRADAKECTESQDDGTYPEVSLDDLECGNL